MNIKVSSKYPDPWATECSLLINETNALNHLLLNTYVRKHSGTCRHALVNKKITFINRYTQHTYIAKIKIATDIYNKCKMKTTSDYIPVVSTLDSNGVVLSAASGTAR